MSEEKVEKKLPETLKKMLPMAPAEGPPLPSALGIKWPWVKK